jgi:iron-sulfur cluster assembly accessory protein
LGEQKRVLIDFTNEALAEAIKKSENEGRDIIRVGVTGGGCAGYEYIFTWDDNIIESDLLIDFGQIKVVVDHLSANYIGGSIISYEEIGLNSQFKINNPREVAACGCGVSVSLDTNKINTIEVK